MEYVPTHQLSSAQLWGSREGWGGGMCNECMHLRNNSIKSISPPTMCCSLALPVTNKHLPPNVPACGGNWLRRDQPLNLNGRFIVSKPRRLHASQVSKPCHTTFYRSCCWSAAGRRENNEFHLSALVSGSVFARAVSPPGCHTYLPHLKERSAVHIFSNTRVCFLLYSEERLERSGESPILKI